MTYKKLKEALEKLNVKDDQEIWIKAYNYEGHQGKYFISRAVLMADSDGDVQCHLEAEEK